MNSRCAWGSKSTGRGVCDQPCEGRYCEHHARVAAVREAGAALRAASEAVAKARDAVVEAAKRQRASWESLPPPAPDYDDRVNETEEAVRLLIAAERAEAEARAKLEALQ